MTGDDWRADAKHELRAAALESRKSLLPDRIANARTAVRAFVLAACDGDAGGSDPAGLTLGRPWRLVAGFDPLRTEVGSRELLDELTLRGVRVIVPITLPDRDLDWTAWPHRGDDQASADSHRLGPDAIREADLVLVPALAVAAEGARLGRGGGSFDRALARVAPGTPLVALVYSDEVVDELPGDPWDIPMTHVVTPEGWQRLGGTEPSRVIGPDIGGTSERP